MLSDSPISFVSEFYARRALRHALLDNNQMTHPDFDKFYSSDHRQRMLDVYNRDCANILHDLGGMAAAW
jgi:hypothetical protein